MPIDAFEPLDDVGVLLMMYEPYHFILWREMGYNYGYNIKYQRDCFTVFSIGNFLLEALCCMDFTAYVKYMKTLALVLISQSPFEKSTIV